MTSTWKGDGLMGGLKICHMSADSFFLKTKDLFFIFADGGWGTERGGSQNLSFFVAVINV